MSKLWSVSIAGWLRRGKLDVNRDEVAHQLSPHEDCEVSITIEPAEARRSNQANRYLWGPIYSTIADFTGQPKEDIHNEMCARFTTKTIHYTNPASGEIVEMEVVTRTSGMTVGEFHRFVERVKLFAQEFFGLTFQEPDEDYQKEYDRAVAREKKGQAA